MEPMLLGQVMTLKSTQVNHGYWLPADGNDGIAAVEVFFASDEGTQLLVTVFTKSSDEDDDQAIGIGLVSLDQGTATPVYPFVFRFKLEHAKDLVRYDVRNNLGGVVTLHLEFAEPSWVDN